MPSVESELAWGDERLAAGVHPLGARFDPGGPFGALAPLEPEGDDVLLFVPPRARAWVHTANGWRDLATLRVLGCVTPDPCARGAARVRLRPIARARGLVPGAAICARVEAWLALDGFWLRVALTEDAPPTPRWDRRALRSTLALGALTVTLLAGALGAMAAVPPRRATLSTDRLGPTATPRWIVARADAPERPPRWVETKQEVVPAPPGGPVLADVLAREAGTPRADEPAP
ncbi:MAG: hypothetical protein KF729_32565, partial [Sandaracinaceae bacterium]|nr:hypothetical protein [Sandaracinaceae bacterium]